MRRWGEHTMTRREAIGRGRLITLGWFASALALALAAAASPWFLALAFGVTIVAGVWLMSLRCERCGYPVYQKKVSIAGAEFSFWVGRASRRCATCGHGEGPEDVPVSASVSRMRIVLVFLTVVNLVGGIGLAQRVDERFVWVAIIVPGVCLCLLVFSILGIGPRSRSRTHTRA